MHATHTILVHVPSAVEEDGRNLSEMSRDELTACVVAYAQKMTEPFYGLEFDSQDLLEKGQDEDHPFPVLFSKDNWDAFKEWLAMCDKGQKAYSMFLLNHINKIAGTNDIGELAKKCFLSYDCTADLDPMRTYEREFSPARLYLKTLANLICGTYCYESEFYNTYEGNAYVPFISGQKEKPDDWALVAFDCHS